MEETTEGRDPESADVSAHGGGRTSQGPNPDPGGEIEPGGLLPPYEDRSAGSEGGSEGASLDARAESVERQMAGAKTSPSGQTSSPADEQPVSEDEVTDEVPDSPMGVGKSASRSGEDMADHDGKEAGRRDVGTQGESGRPVGTSDERDAGAIDPQASPPGT